MNRRSFLKTLGLGVAAVVAAPLIKPAETALALPSAPLYVPPERLDFGVPSQRLVLSSDIEAAKRVVSPTANLNGRTVPMLLIQNEFLKEYGGKLPAGSEVMVTRETADRWVANNIAVPGASAPTDLQLRAAQRHLEQRQQRQRERFERTQTPWWEDS